MSKKNKETETPVEEVLEEQEQQTAEEQAHTGEDKQMHATTHIHTLIIHLFFISLQIKC